MKHAIDVYEVHSVRSINLATQALSAGQEFTPSSETAESHTAITGENFGRTLTLHILNVQGLPSTLRVSPAQHAPFSSTEPTPPGPVPSLNLGEDLIYDPKSSAKSDILRSASVQTTTDTPAAPASKIGKGDWGNEVGSKHKVKVAPLESSGYGVGANPLHILNSVVIAGATAVTPPFQRTHSAALAVSAISNKCDAPSTRYLGSQLSSVKESVFQDGSEYESAVADPARVDSATGEPNQTVIQSSLSTAPSENVPTDELRERIGSLDPTAPLANHEDQGGISTEGEPGPMQSLRGGKDGQIDPGLSKLSKETPVQPTSSSGKALSSADGAARAISTGAIHQPALASMRSQTFDVPDGPHASSSEGPVAGSPFPHTQPDVAVAIGNPYRRLDQVSNVGSPIISVGANRMTVSLHDPSLGWVEIKTQSTAGQVEAALVTTSAQTHHALTAQLPDLVQFLSDREVKVSSVAIGQQNLGEFGRNGGGSGSEQKASQSHVSDDPQLGFDPLAGVESGAGAILDSHSTRYISILA